MRSSTGREIVSLREESIADVLRRQVEALGVSAVRTLGELSEMGDSEAVRLAASTKILEIIGVKALPLVAEDVQQQGELDRVDAETIGVLERLERNYAARPVLKATPELDALIVLEGEDDDVVVGGVIPGNVVLDID